MRAFALQIHDEKKNSVLRINRWSGNATWARDYINHFSAIHISPQSRRPLPSLSTYVLCVVCVVAVSTIAVFFNKFIRSVIRLSCNYDYGGVYYAVRPSFRLDVRQSSRVHAAVIILKWKIHIESESIFFGFGFVPWQTQLLPFERWKWKSTKLIGLYENIQRSSWKTMQIRNTFVSHVAVELSAAHRNEQVWKVSFMRTTTFVFVTTFLQTQFFNGHFCFGNRHQQIVQINVQ